MTSLLVMFVILQLLDILTTKIGLSRGRCAELNPFYQRVGQNKVYWIKLGYVVCATAYFLLSPYPEWILQALVVGSGVFVAWNVSQLMRYGMDYGGTKWIR